MPASTPKADSLAALSREIVMSDPVLQRMLKQLVRDAIGEAFYTMQHGGPNEKNALMRSLTPHMLEALRQTQQTEMKDAEMAAYKRIMAELRGETGELPPVAQVT